MTAASTDLILALAVLALVLFAVALLARLGRPLLEVVGSTRAPLLTLPVGFALLFLAG